MMKQSEQIRELANQYSFYDLPIAIYITTRGGEILGANEKGRAILQLPLEGEFNTSLTDFYSDPTEHEEILKGVEQRGDEGKWFEKKILLVINGDKNYFRCFARLVFQENTKQAGCVLCMIDETEAAQLKTVLDEFRTDVGSVLHTYSSTLVSMKYTIDSVVQSLAPDPFHQNKQLLPEQAAAALSQPAKQLANSLHSLLSVAASEEDSLSQMRLRYFSKLSTGQKFSNLSKSNLLSDTHQVA